MSAVSDEFRTLAAKWRQAAVKLSIQSRDADGAEREWLTAKIKVYFDCSYDLEDLVDEYDWEPDEDEEEEEEEEQVEEEDFYVKEELPEDPCPVDIWDFLSGWIAWAEQRRGGKA